MKQSQSRSPITHVRFKYETHYTRTNPNTRVYESIFTPMDVFDMDPFLPTTPPEMPNKTYIWAPAYTPVTSTLNRHPGNPKIDLGMDFRTNPITSKPYILYYRFQTLDGLPSYHEKFVTDEENEVVLEVRQVNDYPLNMGVVLMRM
jgi:hypothetical protein